LFVIHWKDDTDRQEDDISLLERTFREKKEKGPEKSTAGEKVCAQAQHFKAPSQGVATTVVFARRFREEVVVLQHQHLRYAGVLVQFFSKEARSFSVLHFIFFQLSLWH